MSGRVIYEFMWGYQDTYRNRFQWLARDVLEELGVATAAKMLLVGSRRPGSTNRNKVCVEPELSEWPSSFFEGLIDSIEEVVDNHHLKNIFFSDSASMRDKPEWIRRDSVRIATAKMMKLFDDEHSVISFCGEARRVDDYYVTPIIQLPNAAFQKYPPLPSNPNEQPWQDGKDDPLRKRSFGYRSLIHAAIYAVLAEATQGNPPIFSACQK